MKKSLFILSLICILGCEDTKVNQNNKRNKNYNKIEKNACGNTKLLELKKDDDGGNDYNEKECIKGVEESTQGKFYKIVFLTKHGNYATKYAYLVKKPIKYNDEKSYYIIPIWKRKNTENFINTLRKNLSDNDFFSFYFSTEYGYHCSPGDIAWIYNTDSVLILKNNEYKEYMIENPNTIIMEC
jgi:hypothetical protein